MERESGRPSKTEQLEIQKQLRKYFDLGITATLAAKQTGLNIKTVCKYFEEMVEQLQEQEDHDFIERHRNERARIINSLDVILLEARESLDSINSEIQSHKDSGRSIPRQLFSQKQETLRFMFAVIERRGVFSLQPTMDENVKKKIEEMKHKNDNT